MLGLLLLLGGCQSGFLDFSDNTSTLRRNVNTPVGDSETLRRVRGLNPDSLQPITTEAGDIWPAPAGNEPTLEDMLKQPGAPEVMQFPVPGSPAYQNLIDSGVMNPHPPTTVPAAPDARPARRGTAPAATAPATPTAPAATPPGLVGQPPGSIIIPNGNGTSTVVRPDGTVTTVPSP
jgi:hypothetical protein